MSKVLITGGTGLIGRALASTFAEAGFEIALLSRKKQDAKFPIYTWNIEKEEIEEEATEGTDAIIHLSGAGIADKRWTDKRKKEIIDSRIKSAKLLFRAVEKAAHKPRVYVSASAVGYYGAQTSNKVFSELSPPSDDFLGHVCSLWEKSADKFDTLGIRTVKIRIGVVLSGQGGVLKKVLPFAKFGLGVSLGSGKQFMPWIHIDDISGVFLKAVQDESMHGAFNCAAPQHITYQEFSETLSHVLGKPHFLPAVPSFLIRAVLGEMSAVILEGSRVSSEKLINTGYKFQFPELAPALINIVRNT